MNQRGSGIDWLLFVLLGFFWGSSYLFIKIGVDAGLAPFTLVAVRLLFGFVLLAGVVLIAREALPRRIGMYGHLLVMAVLSVALPFSLITWAEQSVDSTLAATLNASVPLFVIPIAAFALIDEKVTANKVIGVVVGFIGVAILVGFDPGVLAGTDVMAALALIGSSISYAAGGVYARRFAHGLRPMIPAVVQVGFALLMTAVLALIFESPIAFPWRFDAILAVVWLGLLGSGVAYLVFFRLLGTLGRDADVAGRLPAAGLRHHVGGAGAERADRRAPGARHAAGDRGDRAGQPARALAAGAWAAAVVVRWSRRAPEGSEAGWLLVCGRGSR